MDIGSRNNYPAGKLSNFTAFEFEFEGMKCSSMEGLLQSFKFENIQAQKATCALVGVQAKKKGSGRNKRWKSLQTLWWKGLAFSRKSKEYQILLDNAYNALYENENFRKALDAAGDAIFTHSIGRSNKKETVLTESEFCKRLQYLKDYGRIPTDNNLNVVCNDKEVDTFDSPFWDREPQLWLISDTHFFHSNIIIYCNRPENHDEIMIENWNKTVSPDDLVIHIGDITAGLSKTTDGLQKLKDTFASLNGKKILIVGNHDHKDDKYYIEELGFDSVVDYLDIDEFYLCHYPLENNKYTSHKEMKIQDVHRTRMYGLGCKFLIHGHSHLTDFGGNKYNVSVDLNEFTPVNFKTIKDHFERLENAKEN